MRRPIVMLALMTLAACGKGPGPEPGPVAGDLVLQLTTPNATDGALLIRVVGQLSNVTPAGNYRVSFATQGNTTRVVVTGDITSGNLVRIRVPDISLAGSYTAIVDQAAARDNYALFSVSGYQLSVRLP